MLVLVITLTSLSELSAVPAKRVLKSIRQSDGTDLFIQLYGDEYFHYYATVDGIPIKIAPNGSYYYASWSADSLKASSVLAHNKEGRTMEECNYLDSYVRPVKQNIQSIWKNRVTERNRQRLCRFTGQRRNLSQNTSETVISGEKKGLVILVNFTDVTHSSSNPQQIFNAMMNEVGYKGNGQYGSVHDYFYAQSYGRFSLNFDVIGPVTLGHPMSYYGADRGGEGNDIRPGAMIAEACILADKQIDYSDYDWDGDGIVEQVYVIYAGYGQASGASSNTIWPHEWDLYSSDYGKVLQLDGVTINTYACGSELSGTSGKVIDGIGTTCHEFSHCMGLPDFYDTEGSGNFGMDCWSLMDYGCYNDDGNTPAGYTSYEKMFCGWLTPVELNEACKIKDMQALSEAEEAYIIYNEANKNEYYLLENRQQTGWDSKGYGHGMLVLHVDYDPEVWSQNTINNTRSHQRMTIIPADNSFAHTAISLAGDPFPGKSGKNALTDTSSPAATLYNLNTDGRKYMGKPIENITENDGRIAFDFMGGVSIPVPEILPPAISPSKGEFTARWKPVAEAESYTLQLIAYDGEKTQPSIVLTEDFNRFISKSLGTNDLSSKLDAYTALPGWTGKKVFTSSQGAKLGTAQVQGTLTTPLLNGVENKGITVSLQALSYSVTSSVALNIQLLDETDKVQDQQTVTIGSDQTKSYECSFKFAKDNYKIRLSPQARIYISYLEVQSEETTTITEITDIRDESYTFTGLEGNAYCYCVKAITKEGSSKWSEKMCVDLTTDVHPIISTPGSDENDTSIYTLSGVKVKTGATVASCRKLPKGIYLLKKNGVVKKIRVR